MGEFDIEWDEEVPDTLVATSPVGTDSSKKKSKHHLRIFKAGSNEESEFDPFSNTYYFNYKLSF